MIPSQPRQRPSMQKRAVFGGALSLPSSFVGIRSIPVVRDGLVSSLASSVSENFQQAIHRWLCYLARRSVIPQHSQSLPVPHNEGVQYNTDNRHLRCLICSVTRNPSTSRSVRLHVHQNSHRTCGPAYTASTYWDWSVPSFRPTRHMVTRFNRPMGTAIHGGRYQLEVVVHFI
ncbi:hypothetical protein BKA82DRAFT_3009717 [Pisolithus tinctorius]|nr:hypothetical protein BKA82DRAFT_3009717 [Pisolithus tinctorius]